MIEMVQIDAFTDKIFGGNSAAVVPLDKWLPDDILQAIALENNLSETAFCVPRGQDRYGLRWFTPTAEVALCGHATLATAHYLFTEKTPETSTLTFETVKSGDLVVTREGEGGYQLDLPAYNNLQAAPQRQAEISDILGAQPAEIFSDQFLLAVFETCDQIAALEPDYNRMMRLHHEGHPGSVLVTAAGGEGVDFVSRFFAPGFGINEDPVTGSAHCQLTPFWAGRLGRRTLKAAQISPRGGKMTCILAGDRVQLQGQAVTFMRGKITGAF